MIHPRICECCGRPFPPEIKFRKGTIRQRIYEVIVRSGQISTPDLMGIVWTGADGGPNSSRAVHSHVREINKKLREYGVAIRATTGPGAEYALRRLEA